MTVLGPAGLLSGVARAGRDGVGWGGITVFAPEVGWAISAGMGIALGMFCGATAGAGGATGAGGAAGGAAGGGGTGMAMAAAG